ncbi:MAG: hypothetical protein ACKO8O_10190, partial [Betaproteobacteria bacterium]
LFASMNSDLLSIIDLSQKAGPALAVFHCKLNRCLTSCGVGIAGNKLRCKAFPLWSWVASCPGLVAFFQSIDADAVC